MRFVFGVCGLLCAGLLATAAQACAVQGPPLSVLHRTPPANPPSDIVVLHVTMDPFEGHTMLRVQTRARVDRVVRGRIIGDVIRVEFDTQCSNVSGSGQSGYLVGRVSVTVTGLVMRPQMAPEAARPRPRR